MGLHEFLVPPQGDAYIFAPSPVHLPGVGKPTVDSVVQEIDHQTGHVLWTLGGKRLSFRMGAGTDTWGQHDALLQPDGTLTIFDDGAGPPRVHPTRAPSTRASTQRT
jgi:hypothetical protein